MKRLTTQILLTTAVTGLVLALYFTQNSAPVTTESQNGISSKMGIRDVKSIVEGLVSQQNIPSIALRNLFATSSSVADATEAPLQTKSRVQIPKIPNSQQDREISVSTPAMLVGIVIRTHSRKAFFVKGDNRYALSNGDILQGRYRVLGIRADRVHVKDTVSGLTRTIYLKN